jgi:hypothetical protein
MLRDPSEARCVEEEAAMAQTIPTDQFDAVHGAPPGSRTSMVTGKTWAVADMA